MTADSGAGASALLLTAFGPFTARGGVRVSPNPTEAIVARVAAERPALLTATLPVSFETTEPALSALFEAHRPSAWIGLGVAMSRTRIELETVALNVAHAPGRSGPTDSAIHPGGPLAARTSLPVAELTRDLASAGLPVAQSHFAGTFLCNLSYYVALASQRERGIPGRALFIHVPPLSVVSPEITADVVGRLCDRIGQLS